jgi:hypothetical protein
MIRISGPFDPVPHEGKSLWDRDHAELAVSLVVKCAVFLKDRDNRRDSSLIHDHGANIPGRGNIAAG